LQLLFDLGFLLLLLSYVSRPPNWPDSESEWQNPDISYPYSIREVCIVLYAFSVLVSAKGVNVIIAALTLLAFAISPSTLPLPGSLRFYVLLCVIVLQFFMYHIPTIAPSPLLLVKHQRSFPLAMFLSKGLARIICPLFRFYFLIALVTSIAFSISMSGPLTGPLGYIHNFYAMLYLPGSDLPIIGVAPMDTRICFLVLSVTVWLLILSSAYLIGSSTPIVCTNPVICSSSSAWDIYSQEIGHIARVASYRVTVAYATDYPFPPPLSLIELFLVTIPVAFIRLFGNAQFKRATIARPVWNVTVRPLMIIMIPFFAFLA
jgi:hypothetical protein